MDAANIIGIFLIFGLVLAAAFYQLPVLIWTVMIAVGLILVTALANLAFGVLFIFWLVFLSAAAFANLTKFRRQYIVKPSINYLKKQMPVISATEREALEAGNTWWEKELFCGRPHWTKLFSIPKPTLTQEEQDFLNNQVDTLCGMLNDWQIVETDKNLPDKVWDYLKKEKFFGMVIPKEYGGLGFSALAHSTVVTKIATRSFSTAVNTMVPNSLGPGELLVHYGTDEQKDYYLPRLAKGLEIPCFALTAPTAGSDAGAIPDTGIVCKGEFEGKEVIGLRLTWDKRYITLAPIATVLGLAVQMYDPDHLLGDKTDIGITLCLIPTSQPGVEIGTRHYPMRLAFLNGPTRGKDVFIPLDSIIGGPAMAGQGWRMLMECLSIGRSISLPALSTASGKMTYRYAGAYARVRRQFNTNIASFEGIEEALGNIAGKAYLLEATRIMTAGAVDLKVKPSIASAIAKYHMTELARQVVEHAMDVHAGHMIQVGPRNYLANAHIGMPISITVEGANILTRNLIIFGQGAIRCHPYLLKEVELISAEKPDIAALDQTLMAHIGFYMGNLIRSFAYGLTGGFFIMHFKMKNRRVRQYKKQLTRMSAALALLADTSLITLGGSLKRRERISARLGDIMSYLYLGSAVLKYYHDNNYPESDVDYVCWTLQYCLNKIQVACDELSNNYPRPWLGKLMDFIIFPWGPAYHYPSDKLNHSIIAPMVNLSELRDRITKYSYLSNDNKNLGKRLDLALAQVDNVEPLLKKLSKALHTGVIKPDFYFNNEIAAAKKAGIFTTEEAALLKEYNALKDEIIKVDEFSFDLNTVIA